MTSRDVLYRPQKVLREWMNHINFPRDFDWDTTPPAEAMEWHAKVTDCLGRIDGGATIIDGRKPEAAIIWNMVNFLNSISEELALCDNEHTFRYNMSIHISLFRQMSFLTFREVLELFPVSYRSESGEVKHYDGADIYFDSQEMCYISPSLCSASAGMLCECGIYFAGEDGCRTDIDSEIGEDIIEFIAANCNKALRYFYLGFLDVVQQY